jgi:hypothetical protein
MATGATKPGLFFFIGVFMVTFSTLALQIVQTRILSVVTWYYLAFFTISMAMFGLTAGAVWVYYQREKYALGALSGHLARHASFFAIAILLSFAIQNTLALIAVTTATSAFVWLELAVVMAAPYIFSGIIVSLALTQSPYPVGKVYGVDLVGAAAGCLGAFALLNLTTAYAAMFLIGGVSAVGAMFFARHALLWGRKEPARGTDFFGRIAGRRSAILALAGLAAAFNAFSGLGFEPIVVKESFQRPGAPVYSGWNSFSNIQMRLHRDAKPLVWGPSPMLPDRTWPVRQWDLWIDSDAATAMYDFGGDKEAAGFLRYDVTTLAYNMPRPKNAAAVIGVGGGKDVLSAHLFGFKEITGVDVNPIFINLLTDKNLFRAYAGLADIKGITFIPEEARSWFRSTDRKFDFIQMSLVDTWAATGAGAFTLSENSLYTAEAWECFISRLNDDGIFTVSRWFHPGNMDETGRVVSLASAALMRAGAKNPAYHIALAEQGKLATIIISKRPFNDEDKKAINGAASNYGYRWVVPPGGEGAMGLAGKILSFTNIVDLVNYTSSLPMDMTPPTDDKPFFFNLLSFAKPELILKVIAYARFERSESTGVIAGNVRAATALLNIFLISLFLTAITIVIPLRSAVEDSGSTLVNGATWYFASIGVGFIMVEMAMLQRFSVFLGHPMYSLTVSLFSLILSAGLGAILSERFQLSTLRSVAIWAAATSFYLTVFGWFGGAFLMWFDASPISVKIALSAILISSAGILLGFGFPTGMRLVSQKDPRPTPWLWGVNGACGVLGATVAIWISLCFGISAVFLAGAVCYLSIIPSARMIFSAK